MLARAEQPYDLDHDMQGGGLAGQAHHGTDTH